VRAATGDATGAGKPGGPTLTHVRYDGAALSVAWTGDPNPGTRYAVEVYDDDTRIASADAGPSMTAVVPIELAPDRTYGVTIVANGGWTSLLVGVVTTPVAVPHATTDAATGALTLAMPDAAMYRLRVSVNGAPPGPEQRVDGAEAAVAPPPPGSVAAATLALATVGAGDATSIGPYGAAFALPTQRPELLGAAYDGSTLHVAWTGATGADGYVVTVLDAGVASFRQRVAAPATEASVTPGITGTTGRYTVVVQAATGESTGPPSAPLPLLLAAATVDAVTYDGALLSVTVTPPAGPAPTAYDLALLRDGAPVRAATVDATTLALAADAGAAAAAYTVTVRPRAGLSVGPPVVAPAVLGTPDVAAAVCTTDIVVTPAAGRLAAGVAIDAVLYADGRPGTPVRADGTATFAIPAGAAAVAVAVRGVDGVATGPWSAPVPVPTAVPVVTAARSGRDAVALAWRGDADATFRVTAGDLETVVDGLSATLAAPGAAAASVTEVAGVSTGPTGTVELVPDGPAITAVTVDSKRAVTVGWTGTGTLTGVEPVLRWDGAEVALPAVAPDTHPIAFALPDGVPDGATVALRGVAGVASSPLGDAATLLTVAPAGLAVGYDGAAVTATWDAASPPVDRYVAALAVPGADVVTAVVRDATASFPYAPTTPPAAPPTVTVAAMAGAVARGAFGAPVDVVTETPRVTLAAYDGATLRLAWTGDTTGRYRVDVEAGGVAAAAYEVGGTAVAIPLVPGAWTVAVRAAGPRTTGPAGTVTPVTGSAEVTEVAFDPVGGDGHVAWQAVDGATAYALTLLDGTRPVSTWSAPETTTTVAASLLRAGGTYALSVQPVAATDGLLLTGPVTTVALPATAPTALAVRYDGATVAATWSGDARGYRVSTVTGGTATALGDTSAPRGEWPLAAAADGTALVVQPLDGAWAGAPSAAVPLHTGSLFLGDTWLAPATTPALAATAVALALPDLFTGTPDLSKLTGLGLTLARDAGGYVLTIPATSPVWTFGPGRVDVVQGWSAYVTALQTAHATAGGVRTITEAVSRALPQTFAESLYLAYGLRLDLGCIDLRPGVVLRAEYEAYQSVPGTEQATLSGYVTTAVADYEVVYDAGGAVTGLDGFLSRLVAAGGVTLTNPVPPAPNPRQYGGGGVLDTFATAMSLPFVRLVYPKSFPATNAVGSSFPQQNVVLLAATTLTALDTATGNVRDGVPPGAAAAVYLRGRAVLRPMLRVTVDGAPRLVPVGTTLGDVLAAAGRQPAVGLPLTGVTLRRARAAAVPAGSTAPPRDWSVRVDWSPGRATWLGLPLLHGDRLDLGSAG
jgi:hypothetical protein